MLLAKTTHMKIFVIFGKSRSLWCLRDPLKLADSNTSFSQHIHRNHLKSYKWCPICGEGLGDEYCFRHRHSDRTCQNLFEQRGRPSRAQVQQTIMDAKNGIFFRIACQLREDGIARHSRNKLLPSDVWKLLFDRCTADEHCTIFLQTTLDIYI